MLSKARGRRSDSIEGMSACEGMEWVQLMRVAFVMQRRTFFPASSDWSLERSIDGG